LMGSCHVAHDVLLGNNNIIGNNSAVIPSAPFDDLSFAARNVNIC